MLTGFLSKNLLKLFSQVPIELSILSWNYIFILLFLFKRFSLVNLFVKWQCKDQKVESKHSQKA